MKIFLDLRTKSAAEGIPSVIKAARILLVILGIAIFIAGDYAVGVGVSSMIQLQNDERMLLERRQQLTEQSTFLTAEVEKLKRLYSSRIDTIDFVTMNEVPSIEILSILETSLPYGVALESLKVGPVLVSLEGYAPGDQTVVDFVNTLKTIPIFKSVNIPSTEKRIGKSGSQYGVTFKISCVIVTEAGGAGK